MKNYFHIFFLLLLSIATISFAISVLFLIWNTNAFYFKCVLTSLFIIIVSFLFSEVLEK